MSTNNIVPIKRIVADENQPRKYFDIEKLATLSKSVKKHGIVSPLIVEKHGDDFLLIDGERRLRVAVELGLKEVPVTIIDSKDPVSRLVEQFHIQEMHEGWTPMEKAGVINELVNELKRPLQEVCQMLNIPSRTAQQYQAMNSISAKNELMEAGISLGNAAAIAGVSTVVKKIVEDQDEAFTLTKKKALEKAIIRQIAEGAITKPGEITRLKDTFKSDPKTIEKFIQGTDAQELYVKSKARPAYHLRNAVYNGRYVGSHLANYLQHPLVKPTKDDVTVFKTVRKNIDDFLTFMGEND